MSNLIAVVGPSGSGKSTSLETLNPKETVLVNVAAKPLPFKGWKANYIPIDSTLLKGNYAAFSDAKSICALITHIDKSRPEIKQIILDDIGYNMTFQALEKATEKGYDKFSIIAKDMFNILNTARTAREDLSVVCIFHDEVEDMGNGKRRKIRTIGKMLDNTLTVEGLFTVVLYSEVTINNLNKTPSYNFITQTDGQTTAKSPRGMFSQSIPNDMNEVLKAVNEYYI